MQVGKYTHVCNTFGFITSGASQTEASETTSFVWGGEREKEK